ncbi:DNA excision repair protein ERCC-8-like [Oscarella lobularis]|uniref:DNA excision repair protein ERCC-8-like n=1 Tax=Oscarella lobularis TaxID=121494 RepID=UPI003313E40B
MNFRDVFARQIGLDPPWALPRCVEDRKTRSIDLSKTKDVQIYHTKGVLCLDLDPVDARYLLSGGADAAIAIYDTRNVRGEKTFKAEVEYTIPGKRPPGHNYSVNSIQWYPHDTGMFISSSSDKSLKIWDANRLMVAEQFLFSGPVYCHHLSPVPSKSCLIAVGSEETFVTLCDIKSGSQTHILRGHDDSVQSVCWSPRNEYFLLSGGCDNRILLWDIRKSKSCLASLDQYNGKKASDNPSLGCIAHNGGVNGLHFLPDGLHLLSYGTDHRIRLWDVYSFKNTLVNYGRVKNPGWKKHCQLAVSSCQNPGYVFVPSTTSIQVFDIHRGKKIKLLKGHFNAVNCCIFNSNKQELFSGSVDCNILVWDAKSADSDSTPEKEENLHQPNPFFGDTWSDDDED